MNGGQVLSSFGSFRVATLEHSLPRRIADRDAVTRARDDRDDFETLLQEIGTLLDAARPNRGQTSPTITVKGLRVLDPVLGSRSEPHLAGNGLLDFSSPCDSRNSCSVDRILRSARTASTLQTQAPSGLATVRS